MKRLLVPLLVVVMVVLAASPALAMETCDHEMNGDMDHVATIASLAMHVDHATTMGHISNQGIYTSLKATLDRAASFEQAGKVDEAVQQLAVFVQKVQAQSGIHIDASCAEHLVMHAEHVQMALSGGM